MFQVSQGTSKAGSISPPPTRSSSSPPPSAAGQALGGTYNTWQWELTPFLHHHHHPLLLALVLTLETPVLLLYHQHHPLPLLPWRSGLLIRNTRHTMLNAKFNLQSWKLKLEYQNIQIEDWENAKIRNRPLALIQQHLGIHDQIKRFLAWSSINARVLVQCQGSIRFHLHFSILYVYFESLKEFVVQLELLGLP